MILKETYRYMNYLDNLLYSAYNYLGNRSYLVNTKQTHNKQKANPDAENEIIEVVKPYDVTFKPMDLVNLIVQILDEKERLSTAITIAKRNTEIDIDHSIAQNKKRQEFISKLNYMNSIKSNEKTMTGTGYKMNAVDGNQVSYKYDITEVTTIDFDRDDIKGLIKRLTKICDEVSAKLDIIQLTTEVDFVPTWDVTNTLEDVVGC